MPPLHDNEDVGGPSSPKTVDTAMALPCQKNGKKSWELSSEKLRCRSGQGWKIPSASLALVALFFCGHMEKAGSYLLSPRVPQRFAEARWPSVSSLYAKSPPTATIDLDAIEAFEKQLDDSAQPGFTVDDDLDSNFPEDGDVRTYTIPMELAGKRLDAAISALEPSLSRSRCGLLVTDGRVAVLPEGSKIETITRKSFKVEGGSVLQISHPTEEQPTEIFPQNIPLDILYEDDHMIVLNKAADMVVHPAAGNWDGTIVNALAYYLANESPYGSGEFVGPDGKVAAECGENVDVAGTDGETAAFRPGIVHRLDKGTTGVLVVAKTKTALATLSDLFASRKVKKTYVAVTVGNPGKRVVIDKPIGRHPIHRQRMRVVPDPSKKNSNRALVSRKPVRTAATGEGKSLSQMGRRALSFVDTLAFDGKLSVVLVRIETGRTHQIRVHLQDRHTPIYGDEIYGLSDWNKKLSKTHGVARPLLHAHKIEFDHPVTGKKMVFHAPMTEDMERTANAIWPQGKKERPELFSTTEVAS